MSQPVRLTAQIKGDAQVTSRFMRAGDSIRVSVRAALRELGEEMRSMARAGAPRHHGTRSRTSLKYGPLVDTITPVVRSRKEAIKLSIRPTVFYAYFLEVGLVKNEGQLLTVRKPTTRRTFMDTGAYVATRSLKRRTDVNYETRAMGVQFLQNKNTGLTKAVNLGTRRHKRIVYVAAYKRRAHLTTTPFMKPVWEAIKDKTTTVVAAAVQRGLRAA